MRIPWLCIPWLLILWSGVVPCGVGALDHPPTVVLLVSYHPGDSWTDNELAGLLPALRQALPGQVPMIEYMDAKRFPDPGHSALFRDYLNRKYRDRTVDLVIALDNPALDLLRAHPADLFAGAPVVFGGINGFNPEWLHDRPRMTGVAEIEDMAGPLALALRLHPEARRILAIQDDTVSGRAMRHALEAVLPAFRDRARIEFNPRAPFADLERQLAGLPPETIVLLMTYVTDADGQVFSREDSTRRISAASTVPVYALHETRLGHGIVGGLLLDGREHGAQTAALALRVLAGEDPARIPVESSRMLPEFDLIQLRRFGIDPDRLPPGSRLVNVPDSFYHRHPRLVWGTLAALGLLSFVVLVLAVAVARIRRALLALRHSEARQARLARLYQTLSDTNQAIVRVADMDELFVQTCAILQRLAGFQLVWFGLQDPDGDHLVARVSSGAPALLEPRIRVPLDPAIPADQTLAAACFHAGTILVRNDMPDGSALGALAGLPLRRSGQIVGVLEIGSTEAGAFDPEVMALLEEMAMDISYALDNLDRVRILRETLEQLRESEAGYRRIVETTNEGIWCMDAEHRTTFVNPRMARMLGYASDEMLGQPVESFMFPEDLADHAAQMQARHGARASDYERRFRCRDGSERWTRVTGVPIIDDAGLFRGSFGMFTDITAERRSAEALRDSEACYRALFDNISSGVAIYAVQDDGQDFVFKDFNRAAERMDGQRREELIGRSAREVRPGIEAFGLLDVFQRVWTSGQPEHVPTRLYQDEHLVKWYENYVYKLPTGDLVAVFNDVTTLKQHEELLEHIAYYDALTALPNRVLLADRLLQGMAQVQRRGQRLAVVYLDLDGFKPINDQHGHAVGDQVLIAVAERMKQTLREGDTLARIGGDEFVAVLLDLAAGDTGAALFERLLAAVAEPARVGGDGAVVRVSASLGATFYPQADPIDADQLLRQADQAMYQAKQAGKQRYHVFDSEQDRTTRGHHERLEHIRRALRAREFVLHYQPQVNLRTGQVVGAEALIRWQHPERGLLAPMQFLPAIEQDPLAIEVGEWVIDQALTQLEHWDAAGLDLVVSVNVGSRQLQQPDFDTRLRVLLAAHPAVNPARLGLEILETSALEDMSQVSRVIEACRALGVTCALDDFGTGYSSLAYLKRLPVTLLKIDQSFVRDMLHDPEALAIVESVLGLAASFHREALAEGVELLEHAELLLRLGCELAQGYGIARPMPAQAVSGWVAAWRPDPRWAAIGASPARGRMPADGRSRHET